MSTNPKTILLNDFRKQYLSIRESIDQAVSRVLESGWFILGSELESFEREFAAYIGTAYCLGVASGTEAITLALQGLGIKQGDEVITPCFTAFPTITGIMQANAIPVLVDVNVEDGLINVNKIAEKITPKTRAIVPVHLYGQSCNMEQLLQLADSYGLRVVEDCAQSAGATYKGKQTGSMGDCSAFSFYPTKNLGAYGDAGAIVTNKKEIYDSIVKLRNYGQSVRYYHDMPGINSRMDEMQAAILRAKLPFLNNWNDKRRKIAESYINRLENVEFIGKGNHGTPCYHLFVIKCRKRDRLSGFLHERGIQALIHYPVPVNRQKAFYWQKDEEFEATEDLTAMVLSLPIYPELSDVDLETIINTVNAFS